MIFPACQFSVAITQNYHKYSSLNLLNTTKQIYCILVFMDQESGKYSQDSLFKGLTRMKSEVVRGCNLFWGLWSSFKPTSWQNSDPYSQRTKISITALAVSWGTLSALRNHPSFPAMWLYPQYGSFGLQGQKIVLF